MRRDSCRSVPTMCRPPASRDLVALLLAARLRTSRRRFSNSSGSASRIAALLLELELREHLGVAAEDDVGAAAGHVGGDGDRALATGLRDDVRLVLVLLRVEHVVLDPLLLEDARDGARSSRRWWCRRGRLARLVVLEDLVDDRGELLALGLVDEVLVVAARMIGLFVGIVTTSSLYVLWNSSASVSAVPVMPDELLVDAEEVLERDRRQRAGLFLDPHVLLGLDRLVQAVATSGGPASTRPVNSSMMRTLPSSVTM